LEQREVFEILQGAGDAAFVVDQSGLIRFWSGRAEQLLGFSAANAIGKACFAILGGCSSSDIPVCTSGCVLLDFCHNTPGVSSFDVQVNTASGARKWVNLSQIVARTRNGQLLIHLMRDAAARHRLESLTREIVVHVAGLTGLAAEQILEPARVHPPSVPLTTQEVRILRLLSLGRSTHAIARELSVSLATVRNHVRNILVKFGAHTRLQAVMRAAREGLI
jgi:PAS domain S-box-containing protein